MKSLWNTLMLITLTVFLSSTLYAQKVDIKGVDTSGDETTTIQIKKGEKAQKAEPLWEMVEGTADISGEPSLMRKEARNSWKKACDEWKKELKENNKDNKIIIMNCNNPTCVQETDGSVCSSSGAYKIKTRLD